MKGSFKNSVIKSIITVSGKCNLPKKRTFLSGRSGFLVVSTTGIGDTLWGTPAIKALRETFPDAYICVLTNPAGLEVLKENPDIDDILIFIQGSLGYLSCIGLITKLRKKNITTAFIFHSSDRIIWPICYFSGAVNIIGIEGQSKGLDSILTKTVRPQNNLHGVEARLRLVGESGAVATSRSISINLTSTDRERARHLLNRYGIREDVLLIGFHPGAQKPFKCWPEKNFIETGRKLVQAFGCKILITGDSGEESLARRIASEIGEDAISLAGKLSLRETASVIKMLDLFLTNDTGPMHIAFALKTPAVAMFSPTDPELCGPYHAENAVIIKKAVTCDPCIGKRCADPLCMEQITVNEVTDAAVSLIAANSKAGNRVRTA